MADQEKEILEEEMEQDLSDAEELKEEETEDEEPVSKEDKKAAKKQERWQEISRSAAKQSGRSVIPEVIPVCTFKEALEQAKQLDVILVPYECAEGMKETKHFLRNMDRAERWDI